MRRQTAKLAKAPPSTNHPYVELRPGVCGGQPVIAGTRFPIRSVVIQVLRQGLTPEELVHEFPHLSLAQVYDALSFYYDDREAIDADIAQNTERRWKPRRKRTV
jgi:uncharacterized protein (DUF433 family)